MVVKGKKDLSFEQALKELDAIADTLESDSQDLEANVAKFARGLELIRLLKAKLADSEVTIKELKTKYRDVFSDQS